MFFGDKQPLMGINSIPQTELRHPEQGRPMPDPCALPEVPISVELGQEKAAEGDQRVIHSL
jgi:hypothetical protein